MVGVVMIFGLEIDGETYLNSALPRPPGAPSSGSPAAASAVVPAGGGGALGGVCGGDGGGSSLSTIENGLSVRGV